MYQSDYKEEREAREKIVGEKEKLAEDVRLLKAMVAQLENQLASGSRTTEEEGATANASPPPPSQPVVRTYIIFSDS